ncbi:MAG: hypothetical protein MUF73_20575 [Rhodobacteraceae bacterium]|nr:hypothetical protein [Paracoccaceae bacterium]
MRSDAIPCSARSRAVRENTPSSVPATGNSSRCPVKPWNSTTTGAGSPAGVSSVPITGPRGVSIVTTCSDCARAAGAISVRASTATERDSMAGLLLWPAIRGRQTRDPVNAPARIPRLT